MLHKSRTVPLYSTPAPTPQLEESCFEPIVRRLWFPSYTSHNSRVAKVEQVHADVLSAKVEAEVQTVWDAVPVYAGAGASANLVDMEAGPFTGTLGAGVDSEVGYKDQSVGFKVLGSGVRVERVCEISVFGSKIGIDWGKLF